MSPGDLRDVASRSCRLLSSLGRNLSGVWRTEGAEDGGLKMMWSCFGELLEILNDDSGLTLRRCFVRRNEDSCRLALVSKKGRCEILPCKRSVAGLLVIRTSIAEGVIHASEHNSEALQFSESYRESSQWTELAKGGVRIHRNNRGRASSVVKSHDRRRTCFTMF